MIQNPFDLIDRRLSVIEGLLLDLKHNQSSTPLPEQIFTREQTAVMLDVDKSTLWMWCKKGKIKSYYIGNRVYFKRSEIEEALKPITTLNHK